MENKITPKSYEETKGKAKEFYKKIDSVWCPALKDNVLFGDAGFRHLIWRGRSARNKKDQMKRFVLLPSAPKIIQKSKEFKEYRDKMQPANIKQQGSKRRVISRAQFWGLQESIADKNVTIVIRQIGNGKKHFFSIFEEGNKKQLDK